MPLILRIKLAAARAARILLGALGFVVLPAFVRLLPKRHATLIWAGTPIINIRYWAAALRAAGWQTETLVSSVYTTINARGDYDVVYDDLLPRWIRPRGLRQQLAPYAAFLRIVRRAKVVHLSFDGGPLGSTPLRRREASLLRAAGVRTVVIPYGGDVFIYSRIDDPTLRHALLRSYPESGRYEERVRSRVEYWSREADVIAVGFCVEGTPRWDTAVSHIVAIDLDQWKPQPARSDANGRSGAVTILHAPNHRGVKGTEFVVAAVSALQSEGLDVQLVLAEGVQNSRIRELMQEVDLVVDQLILPYGITAVEAMASGLPVVGSFENRRNTDLFDSFSTLSECPVVSAGPKTVTEVLRRLITDPNLRKELGTAGRAYAEKYHSYAAAQHLFEAIYARELGGHDVDLATLFHPVLGEYNRRAPRVEHPLVDHRLP